MKRTGWWAGPVVGLIALTVLPTAAQAAPVVAAAPASAGKDTHTVLRVATFNVRTARATGDRRSWLERAPDVAREILSRDPGVVALQELGPGRADGRKGTLQGRQRQSTSLLATLYRLGGGHYQLVRSTSYFRPGTKHGTQGTRILYDSSRYTLRTWCPERTGKRNYSRSCAFDLPLSPGDRLRHRRSAAFAELQDRSNGRRFFVVSAHLDHRHSSDDGTEARYNRLRARQAAFIVNRIAQLNTGNLPVVLGGDINSWQWDRGGYAPHRVLSARGYRDAVTAPERVNVAFSTVNRWRTTMRRATSGAGPRLDLIMVKGVRSVERYENKMARVDYTRPSDHNMVVADLVL